MSRISQIEREIMLKKLDRISFELGMINCFVEMVACGVKKMAISPPLAPEDYHLVKPLSEKMIQAFGIKSHLDKSLLITDLQTEDFTKGKWAILYYNDDRILEAYRVEFDADERIRLYRRFQEILYEEQPYTMV